MRNTLRKWIDLGGGEEGLTGQTKGFFTPPDHGASTFAPDHPFSSKLMDKMVGLTDRSESSVRGITSGLEQIRTRATQLQAHVAGHFEDGAPDGSKRPKGREETKDRAFAFRTRLQTQGRVMKSSFLRGAPAAAVDLVIARLSEALARCEDMSANFPIFVRQISAKQLTSVRQALVSGSRTLQEAGAQVEAHAAEFDRREHRQSVNATIEDSRRRMISLRDHVVSLAVFKELLVEMHEWGGGELSEEGGDPSQRADGYDDEQPEDLSFAAASVSSHLRDLHQAHDPTTIAREVECVRMAFVAFLDTSRSAPAGRGGSFSSASASAAASSSAQGQVPKSLLNRIEASKRNELATMDPSKALHLLRHTRSALASMDPASEEHKKLGVIEKILSIRAKVSPVVQQGSGPDDARHVYERWRLRKPIVLGELTKLSSAAQLVGRIETKAKEEKAELMAKMNAAFQRTKKATAEQVHAQVGSLKKHWTTQVSKSFTHFLTQIIVSGSALADATIAALETFVSSGFLMKEDPAPAKQSFTAGHSALGPSSSSSASSSSAFVEGIGAEDDDDEAQGGRGDRGDASTQGALSLMKKVFELCLETYDAWRDFVITTLESNAEGTDRAVMAMQSGFGPSGDQFARLSAD